MLFSVPRKHFSNYSKFCSMKSLNRPHECLQFSFPSASLLFSVFCASTLLRRFSCCTVEVSASEYLFVWNMPSNIFLSVFWAQQSDSASKNPKKFPCVEEMQRSVFVMLSDIWRERGRLSVQGMHSEYGLVSRSYTWARVWWFNQKYFKEKLAWNVNDSDRFHKWLQTSF